MSGHLTSLRVPPQTVDEPVDERTTIRWRLACVYCGERPTLAGLSDTHDRRRNHERRRAARIACPRHRALVALDPLLAWVVR